MEGSVATAVEMARQAKRAGAWGLKTQLLKPETIAREDAPKYWTDLIGTANQREAFTTAGLVDYGEWREVKQECDRIGIEFLATPFDLEALDILLDMGCGWVKIASGDITYQQLLEAVGRSGARVILSTGASHKGEIGRALRWLGTHEVTLLACTLSYPTPAGEAHLARIETLREFGHVGYSDHTSLPHTGMCAAALGSEINEVHYTLDRNGTDVPDHKMAVDPPLLAEYVAASEFGARLRGSPQLLPARVEGAAMHGARRSITATRDLLPGRVLVEADFAFLRPGDGIPPFQADRLLGRVVRTTILAGRPISLDHLA